MQLNEFIEYLNMLPKFRNPILHVTYADTFYEISCVIGKTPRKNGETQSLKIFFSEKHKKIESAIKQIYDRMEEWL